MTTQTVDNDLLVVSPVSEVYNIPFGNNYRVKSKLFDCEHVVKAYACRMEVDEEGWLDFSITNKSGGSGRKIGRPFHLLKDGLLCAMKRYKHYNTDSFALNHELFSFQEWEASVILHHMNGKPYIFIISREEWMANGRCGHQNEELQVFIEVPNVRRLPVDILPPQYERWLQECLAVEREMS